MSTTSVPLEVSQDGTFDLDDAMIEFGVEETKENFVEEKSAEKSAPKDSASARGSDKRNALNKEETKIPSVEERVPESAAKHTYDKGYTKWEKFDVEAELAKEEAAPEPRRTKTSTTKSKDESSKAHDAIDFDLPMFESLEASQKEGVIAILKLDNSTIDALPTEKREIVIAYRQMYQDQKRQKLKGPIPPSPPRDEKDTETENHKEKDSLLKDLERLKLMPHQESNKKWQKLQSIDREREDKRQHIEQQQRQQRVGTALSNLPKAAQDIDSRLQGAAEKHKLSKLKSGNKARERKKQLAAIRQLAAPAGSSELFSS